MMSWVLKISIPALVFVFTSPAMAYGNCDSFMNSMSDDCKENRRIEARIKMLQERARKRKLRRNKKSYKKASNKPYRHSNNSRRTSNRIAPKHYQLKNWNVRTQPSLRRSQVIETAGQRDYKLMTKKLANGKKALVTSSNGVWYALTCSTCDEPVWINRKALIRKEAPPVRQKETFVDDHKPVVTAKKQPIQKVSEKKKPKSRSVKIHKPKKVAEKKKDSVDSFINDIASEAAFDLGFGEAKNPTKKNKKPIAKKEVVEKKIPQVSLSKAEKAQKKFNELKSKAYKAEIVALAAEKQAEKVKNSNLAPTAKREATQKRLAAQKAAKEMSNANKKLLNINKEVSKKKDNISEKKGLSRGLLANTKKNSKPKQLVNPKKVKTVGQAKKNFKQFKDKAYHAKLAEVEAEYQAKKMKAIANKAAKDSKGKSEKLLLDINKAKIQYDLAKEKALKATLDLEKTKKESKKKLKFYQVFEKRKSHSAKKQIPQKEAAVKQAEGEMKEAFTTLNKLKTERMELQSKTAQSQLAADRAGKEAKKAADNYNASEKEMNVAYKGLLKAEKEEEKRKALAEQKRLAEEAKEKERQDALAQQKANEKAKQDALAKEKTKALADKKAKEKKKQELADKKAKEKERQDALAKKKEEEKKKKELAEKKKEKSFEEKHKRKAFCVKNDKQLRNSPLWEKLGKQSPYGTTWSGVKSHWWVGNITIRMTFNKNGSYTGRGTDDSGKVRGSDRGILQVCYRGGRLYTYSRSLSTRKSSRKTIRPGQRVFTLDHDKLGPIRMTKVSQ